VRSCAVSKHQFPIAAVDPAAKFVADFLQLSDRVESKSFEQYDTGWIGKGDASDDAVKPAIPRLVIEAAKYCGLLENLNSRYPR
jgi:hypothetical protein